MSALGQKRTIDAQHVRSEFAAGNAVVPSPHPRSKTLSPLVIPRSLTSASPLSLILSAMRVKSPFSQSALFGFIGVLPMQAKAALGLVWPCEVNWNA